MPIRVLQICASLSECGGVQTVIRNYYAHMNQKEFIFDFIVFGADIGGLERWFEQRGSHIYHVTPRSVDFPKNTKELKQIIQHGNYDVVHCHQNYMSLIAVLIAKFYGVKKIIVHSHAAIPNQPIHKRIIKNGSVFVMKLVADELMSCGVDAAKWLYGEHTVKKGKVTILNNAIDLALYGLSTDKRHEVRKNLGIENKLVLGNIARFTYQKNHKLLLEVFSEFHSSYPESALLLVGEGELKEEMEAYCDELGLSQAVIFYGVSSNVPDMLSAMDVFVLPSRFEGLALIMIEAQANGIPAVCSANVTKELGIQENVLYVGDNDYENLKSWENTIMKAYEIGRLQDITALTEAGFNIRKEAQRLEEIYRK